MTTPLPDRAAIARDTARALIEIEAIRISPERPFMFSSGLASPVYIDCRRIISFPNIRERLMDHATAILRAEIGLEAVEAIAGGETAGIPFAAWIAANTRLPMHYVRKRPKGYGPNAQVEGVIPQGQRVLLIEDLTTDGGSKVRFVNALRRAGAQVADCLVIFYYDIFPQTRAMLADHGLRLHSLANWQDILTVADDPGPFNPGDLAEIRAFLDDPLDWSARHGGAARLTL
ncbi:orotate phosphoribosyltransferase [Phaeovulum sp. NW3]|uniref:orotate phosphoribosyltransferase n=1 Tax=Phaeovulum sp. NW3 TaxID=2934933 RepID=UPI002021A270|nr:orotate phosphoribosyltransferase [Phaeovulum sp. NW3]MCL7466646.1 orotate phosphoribosyltransferase [Phaeovulum sp. NW3]